MSQILSRSGCAAPLNILLMRNLTPIPPLSVCGGLRSVQIDTIRCQCDAVLIYHGSSETRMPCIAIWLCHVTDPACCIFCTNERISAKFTWVHSDNLQVLKTWASKLVLFYLSCKKAHIKSFRNIYCFGQTFEKQANKKSCNLSIRTMHLLVPQHNLTDLTVSDFNLK